MAKRHSLLGLFVLGLELVAPRGAIAAPPEGAASPGAPVGPGSAASPAPTAAPAELPAYTLALDSDEPDVSFDALAALLAGDLRAPIAPAGPAASVALTVVYRRAAAELLVRADHGGSRVIERRVKAATEPKAVLREAALLAGNLARDEARELLDVLAPLPAPPAPAPAPTPPPAPPAAPSPSPASPAVPMTVSILYPLATNAGQPDITTHLDLALFYGRVGAVTGAQLSGLAAHASGPVRSLQLATAVTVADGEVHGVQGSGFVAVARGGVDGVQSSSLLGLTTGPSQGAQVSGALNVATASHTGLQLAGSANFARVLDGVQVAPLNVGGDVSGIQFGVINVGRRVKGVQIGVLNVAEDVDGQALGLVSISRDSVHPIFWGSNLAYTNAGLKFTGRYLFTSVAATYGALETAFRNVGVTAELGTRVPVPRVPRLDAEPAVSFTTIPIDRDRDNMWLSARLDVGYRLAKHLRFFVGASSRFAVHVDEGRSVIRPEVRGGLEL